MPQQRIMAIQLCSEKYITAPYLQTPHPQENELKPNPPFSTKFYKLKDIQRKDVV